MVTQVQALELTCVCLSLTINALKYRRLLEGMALRENNE